MKGVSSAAAAIIIATISVALVGTTYFFTSGIMERAGAETFEIIDIFSNKLIIRNTGTQMITELRILVDGKEVGYEIEDNGIQAGKVGTVTIIPTEDIEAGVHELIVISKSMSQTWRWQFEYVTTTTIPGVTTTSTVLTTTTFEEEVTGQSIEFSMTTEQGPIEIGKPVEWKSRLDINNPSTVEVKNYVLNLAIPTDASNILIKDVEEKILAENEKLMRVNIAGKNIVSYFVEYETPAPYKEESIIKAFVSGETYKKRINVKSDFSGHYQDVKAYTDIPEEIFQENYKVKLYRIVHTSKIDVTDDSTYEIKFVDSDNDGLNDRMEWTVPQLSEEEFEVKASITIINVQSYPAVWGNWIVRFNTTGIANLTITPINGTNFDVDIKFLELKCGDEVVSPVYDGKSVFYENWSCSEEGKIINQVLKPGKHTLEFRYGDDVEYAYNLALYFDDFETDFGNWVPTGGSCDWTRDQGGTQSPQTGPDHDNTIGDATGWYIYVETSGSVCQGSDTSAIIEGPNIDADMYSIDLSFYYHMYGSNIGTLHVDVYDGSWHNDEWSIYGQQHGSEGAAYTQAQVDLDSYTGTIRIRFRYDGVTGFRSDAAIDDINISGTLRNQPPDTPTNITCNGNDNCNIEIDTGVTLQANGSTDPDTPPDTITYYIEAYLDTGTCSNSGDCSFCDQTECEGDCSVAGCSWSTGGTVATPIYFTGFEVDDTAPWDGWVAGGADCLMSSSYSAVGDNGGAGGTDSIEVQDNSASSYTAQTFDLSAPCGGSACDTVNISFYLYPESYDNANEGFDIWCDYGTAEAVRIVHWQDTDGDNCEDIHGTIVCEDSWTKVEIDISSTSTTGTECALDSPVEIRVTSQDFSSGGNVDQVYIDGINITGYKAGTLGCSGPLDCSGLDQSACQACSQCSWDVSKQWIEIGSHVEGSNFFWDTSSLEEQNCIDLRTRAIDLTGSNTYSGYYTKESCLNIIHAVGWLDVTLLTPDPFVCIETDPCDWDQGSEQWINASVECKDGNCGDVSALAMYNDSLTSMIEIPTSESDPFYIIYPITGDPDNSWYNVTPDPPYTPPARSKAAMAYDSNHDRTILFGGSPKATGGQQNDTWVFNYTDLKWYNVTSAMPIDECPPSRYKHAMTYDSKNDRTILFGGDDVKGVEQNDTWVFNYTDLKWYNVTPDGSPPPRFYPTMVYDSGNDAVVMFGGTPEGSIMFNDTWVLNYSDEIGWKWYNITPDKSPRGREMYYMSYDSDNKATILFGGYIYPDVEPQDYLNDTWVLNYSDEDGWKWYEIISDDSPVDSPSERYGHTMAYDSESKLTILFGGYGDVTNHNDTWVFNYTDQKWYNVTTTGPSVRRWHSMAYDSKHDRTILFGGYYNSQDTNRSDTWVLNYTFGGVGNPLSCGSLSSGDSCQLNWTVKVTGSPGEVYRLDVNFSSNLPNVDNNDTSDAYIRISYLPLRFEIKLPGKTPVSSSGTESGNPTTPIEFNASSKTETVEPCVWDTFCSLRQTSLIPIFNFTNTGNVAEQWNISYTGTLPSDADLYGNTIYDYLTAIQITPSGWIPNNNIQPGGYQEVWLWADFVDAPPDFVEVTINHTSMPA